MIMKKILFLIPGENIAVLKYFNLRDIGVIIFIIIKHCITQSEMYFILLSLKRLKSFIQISQYLAC